MGNNANAFDDCFKTLQKNLSIIINIIDTGLK